MESINDLYESCKIQLLNKVPFNPPFSNIEDWMSASLNVSPLNISYDAKFSMLKVVFKDENDLEKFTNETIKKFKTVPLSRFIYQNFLKDTFDFYDNHLFLDFMSFNQLALRYISSISNIGFLQKELNINSLWKIYIMGPMRCVFFFQNEIGAEKYNEKENKDYLIDKFFAFLKKNDEFNLISKKDIVVNIDIKETLEVKYQGSMQFYSKDH